MKYIFIDTNVFLEFYKISSEDLKELKKLSVEIENGEVTVYLPSQVKNEYLRNRESVVNQSLKDVKFNIPPLPRIAQGSEHYAELVGKGRELSALRNQVHRDLLDKASSRDLEADQIISEIFSKIEPIAASSTILKKAEQRFLRGDPPRSRDKRKYETLGDCINWELLLEVHSNEEDICFISNDGDYKCSLHEEEICFFLKDEWEEKKSCEIKFYKSLTDYFLEFFPEIHLHTELERHLVINNFIGSVSFFSTHRNLRRLINLLINDPLTNTELQTVIEAFVENSQIYGVLGDPDLVVFIRDTLIPRIDDVSEELRDQFFELLPDED